MGDNANPDLAAQRCRTVLQRTAPYRVLRAVYRTVSRIILPSYRMPCAVQCTVPFPALHRDTLCHVPSRVPCSVLRLALDHHAVCRYRVSYRVHCTVSRVEYRVEHRAPHYTVANVVGILLTERLPLHALTPSSALRPSASAFGVFAAGRSFRAFCV